MLESTIKTMQVDSIAGKIVIDEKFYQVNVNETTVSCYANLMNENINVSINIETKKSSVSFNNVSSIENASLLAKQIETQLILIITEIESK